MKRSLLPGYSETIRDQAAKERYVEKLKILKGEDPSLPPVDFFFIVDRLRALSCLLRSPSELSLRYPSFCDGAQSGCVLS